MAPTFVKRETLAGKCPKVCVHLLPDLNHVFQCAPAGGPSRFSELGEPFQQRVVDPICDWLDKWSQ